MSLIRRASAQGVSDHRGRSPLDNTSTFFFSICFWNICNRSQLKQPFPSNFSKPEPRTRIRATIPARAIVSCLSYAHARRRPWEPPDTLIVSKFRIAASLFWTDFRSVFFLKNGANWSPRWHQKCNKIWYKTTLETKFLKHAENVPNSMPLDLQETRFRIEWLPKITKTRSADKYEKHMKKGCRNEAKIH